MANFPWPNGNRCAVALTFDMDGECIPFVYDPAERHPPPLAAVRGDLRTERRDRRAFSICWTGTASRQSFFVPGFTAERHPDISARR